MVEWHLRPRLLLVSVQSLVSISHVLLIYLLAAFKVSKHDNIVRQVLGIKFILHPVDFVLLIVIKKFVLL